MVRFLIFVGAYYKLAISGCFYNIFFGKLQLVAGRCSGFGFTERAAGIYNLECILFILTSYELRMRVRCLYVSVF